MGYSIPLWLKHTLYLWKTVFCVGFASIWDQRANIGWKGEKMSVWGRRYNATTEVQLCFFITCPSLLTVAHLSAICAVTTDKFYTSILFAVSWLHCVGHLMSESVGTSTDTECLETWFHRFVVSNKCLSEAQIERYLRQGAFGSQLWLSVHIPLHLSTPSLLLWLASLTRRQVSCQFCFLAGVSIVKISKFRLLRVVIAVYSETVDTLKEEL